MARYGNLAQQKVKKVMEERRRARCAAALQAREVTSRKQAIAIRLGSPARGRKGPEAKDA
jgi:hypothetical protein